MGVVSSKQPQIQSIIMEKIVFKVGIHDEKTKIKAMKNVTRLSGIESVRMDMMKQTMTLIALDVDCVAIVKILRRKVCMAEIVSVGRLENARTSEMDVITQESPQAPTSELTVQKTRSVQLVDSSESLASNFSHLTIDHPSTIEGKELSTPTVDSNSKEPEIVFGGTESTCKYVQTSAEGRLLTSCTTNVPLRYPNNDFSDWVPKYQALARSFMAAHDNEDEMPVIRPFHGIELPLESQPRSQEASSVQSYVEACSIKECIELLDEIVDHSINMHLYIFALKMFMSKKVFREVFCGLRSAEVRRACLEWLEAEMRDFCVQWV